MLEIVLSASILSPRPFGRWLEQISKAITGEGGRRGSISGYWGEEYEKEGPITQPVYTDSGEALLYPVDINEEPHICDFRGFFQFIP